jgi:hypothetical protein
VVDDRVDLEKERVEVQRGRLRGCRDVDVVARGVQHR